ncbi:MAG TPA: ATP-binding protein [Thermoleophilia bacterium]|nr:ATP-binding protein [Thermoleophilia bacterium]
MELRVRGGKSDRLLVIKGEIDHENVGDLVRAFEETAAAASADVNLDLTGVTYIDSAGICAFYDLADRLDWHGLVRITGISRDLHRIFHISGLLVHDRVRVATEDMAATTVSGGNAGSCPEGAMSSWTRSFPARLDQLAPVRAFVEEIATRVALAGSRAYDLKLAVSEAAANAIEHGQKGGDLGVVAICRADRITVTVSHPGDFRPRPPGDPARLHRGMGLPIMLALTDEVTVSRLQGGGTCVSLSVYLGSATKVSAVRG